MNVLEMVEPQKGKNPDLRKEEKPLQSKEVDGKTLYLDEPSGEWVSKK
jgi:hypothetical protein